MSEARELVTGLGNPLDQWARQPSPTALPQPNVAPAPQAKPPDTVSGQSAIPPEWSKVAAAIIGPESGGRPNVLYGGGDMNQFPDKAGYYGFPDWPGRPAPHGESHAASEWQFQPDTWKDVVEKHPELGLDNFRDPAQRAKAATFLMSETYRNVTGRDLDADIKSGKTTAADAAHILHAVGPWKQDADGTGRLGYGWAQEDRAQHSGVFSSAQEMQREYLRLANAETPGSKERMDLMRKARESSDRATEAFERLQKTPPIYKPVDILENFGSAATLLAIIGGLFAKRPLAASLNAAGLAMQAQQQGNWDKVKVASDQWKTQAEMGLQQARLAHDQIREVIEDERMAENEKQAKLHALLSGYQMGEQARWHDMEYQQRMSIAREQALQRAQESKDRWQMHVDTMQGAVAEKKREQDLASEMETARASGDPQGIAAAEQKIADFNTARGKGLNITAQQSAKLGDEELTEMADEYMSGNRMVTTRLGAGAIGSQNRAAFQKALTQRMKDKGFKPEDISLKIAEFEGLKAGERTLANRSANMGMKINEAKVFAPLALAASDKVSRTNFPRFNDILLAAEKGTGDENVVELAGYTNSLLTAYANAITPSNVSTEGAQQRARGILDYAWSQGQFRRGIDVILKELDVARTSPGVVQQEFQERFRGGQSVAGSPTPAIAPSQRYTATGPKGEKIHSDDGVNWLREDGTPYK